MSEPPNPLYRLNVGESSIEPNREGTGYDLVPCEAYYLGKLAELKNAYRYDPEAWHSEADELLLCALEALGWTKFAAKYQEAQKHFYYC